MKNMNWSIIDYDFIDCPPWPDIGMPKDKFLKKFGIKTDVPKDKEVLSILDYYSDAKPDFEKNMLSYFLFEKVVPNLVKFFWAHHKYYVFVKEN